jgi:hypothetical protein
MLTKLDNTLESIQNFLDYKNYSENRQFEVNGIGKIGTTGF